MNLNQIQENILSLKKERNAMILAHYYQTMDIQEIADCVGDSYEMARRASEAEAQVLVICGVRFMAESAKILNPGKTVLLPAPNAGCPMADMITAADVVKLREQYPDAAVVCYVNSSSAVKAVSDVCCTSSSAERIVRAIPEKRIIFIPDQNLGAYVAKKVPEKEIILFDGFCPVHHNVTESDVLTAKNAYPNAKLLIHPECKPAVLNHADYIGSTSGIIDAAIKSDAREFIIGTETGVIRRLEHLCPDKAFYPLTNNFLCPNMKKTSLESVQTALEEGEFEIVLSESEMDAARKTLERMISL